MPTNLSKYTVGFSDFAWESVDLSTPPVTSLNGAAGSTNAAKPSDKVPMFPKAWHVGRYLESYARAFLKKAVFRTNSTVKSAIREDCESGHRWKVNWTRSDADVKNAIGPEPISNDSRTDQHVHDYSSGVFDYLIVASGFFGTPKIPPLPGSGAFPRVVLHSTELRKLEGLSETRPNPGKILDGTTTHALAEETQGMRNVVVVGGGMSGAEAAASLALQISTLRHSPERVSDDKTNYQVYHVTSRPFYALPTYAPIDPSKATELTCDGDEQRSWNSAPAFAPLDLCLYNITRRRPGLISDYTGALTAAQSNATHRYLSALVGGYQLDLGSGVLHISNACRDKPPRVVLTDSYSEFVRSSAIIPVFGRVESLGMSPSGQGNITVGLPGKQQVLEDVHAVVMATGLTPQRSLEWLPQDVLDTLQHDKEHHRIPLILQHGSYSHSGLPELGFVGFYEGPYWGIMEMQARMLVQEWAFPIKGNVMDKATSNEARESERQQMLALRAALTSEPESFSQFWMGDYVGFMEFFARVLSIDRTELDGFEERGGPLVPARYTSTGDDLAQASRTLANLDAMMQTASSASGFVAKATFRAMQGTWDVKRVLKSAIPTYPSGTFSGIAQFHPRQPTDQQYDTEYLYAEEGDLVTENGMTMRGSRQYAYRYEERSDAITAWFIKPQDGRSVDYLFHKLRFCVMEAGDEKANTIREGWVATGHHLCVADDYDSSYLFHFRGAALERFKIQYIVKGPKKDYVSETWYERPDYRRTKLSV